MKQPVFLKFIKGNIKGVSVIPVDDVSMIHIDYVDPFRGWRSITA